MSLLAIKLKAMIAANCISLYLPPPSLVGTGDGVYHEPPTRSQDLRQQAQKFLDEADHIEKCDKLGREVEALLK